MMKQQQYRLYGSLWVVLPCCRLSTGDPWPQVFACPPPKQKAALTAICELTIAMLSRPQRMAGLAGRTAAWRSVSEWPVGAASDGYGDALWPRCRAAYEVRFEPILSDAALSSNVRVGALSVYIFTRHKGERLLDELDDDVKLAFGFGCIDHDEPVPVLALECPRV